jgi:hypothetical protein
MESSPKLEDQSNGICLNTLRPVENHAIPVITTDSAVEYESQSDGYVSQQDLIRKKMLESGLTEDIFEAARSHFEDHIRSRYGNGSYTKDWRRWRAESKLWDYYCEAYCLPNK